MLKAIVGISIVVILVILTFILIMPTSPASAAELNVQTSYATFNNCTVISSLTYTNGSSISGTCTGGYWWSIYRSAYLNITYRPGMCVTIKGVPNTSKQITGAQLVGIGYGSGCRK
jgi:hypothetical protein